MFHLHQEPTCQCRRCKRPWVRCLGQEDPLEKEMATCSNILAQKIPWTEEPGRLWGLKELDTAERGHIHTEAYGPGDSLSDNSGELLQRSMGFSSCMSSQNKVHQTSQGHILSRLKKKKDQHVHSKSLGREFYHCRSTSIGILVREALNLYF